VVGAIRDEAVDGLPRGRAVPLGQSHRASELAASRRPAVEVRDSAARVRQAESWCTQLSTPLVYSNCDHAAPHVPCAETTPSSLAAQLLALDSTRRTRSPPRLYSQASMRCRFVVYTCYQPATMATPEDLALKRRAFDEHRVTTHWPAAGVCMPQEGSRDRKDFSWERTRDRVRAREHMPCQFVQHVISCELCMLQYTAVVSVGTGQTVGTCQVTWGAASVCTNTFAARRLA